MIPAQQSLSVQYLPPVRAVEWDPTPSEVMPFAARAEADQWALEAGDVSERVRRVLRLQESPLVVTKARRVSGGYAVNFKARHINGWLTVGGRQISILPKYVRLDSPQLAVEQGSFGPSR
jgi:hypothetical protein